MILIDMKMPGNCYSCILCRHADVYCRRIQKSLDRDDWYRERDEDCPLHEVIADPDTVSRKEALDAVDAITKWSLLDRNGCHVGVGMKYRDVKETVKSLPSSSSIPKGHWTNVSISVTGDLTADCSRCGATVHNSLADSINFCPNCGADMR